MVLERPVTAQPAAQPVGIVDRVTGRWLRVQDRQPLARGDLLYERQTVTIGRSASGEIAILMFAGNERWEKRCTTAAPCAGSFRPAARSEQGRGFWSFLSSFWKSGEQLPPVLAGSRGTTSTGPQHALVLAGDRATDLEPALRGLAPGRYALRLTPAPGGSLAGSSIENAFDVAVAAGERVAVASIPAGLYMLSVADAAGQTIGAAALVLVRAAPDRGTRELWLQAQSEVAGLPGIDGATRAALLAHTLYVLDAGRQ